MVRKELFLIKLRGDSSPWDVARGGEVVYEHPGDGYPKGRVVCNDYELERQDEHGRAEIRRAAYGEVTICPR